MAKIGLFFGSDEGNTENIAGRIAQRLGPDNVDIYDIADVTQAEFEDYSCLILGISTWDFGQIQSDWEEFWFDVEAIDFTGKKVALYGLGDQFGYGDFFVDAMGMLHDVVRARGADIVGHWPIEGYEFDASKALAADGVSFVGLAIDEDQQANLTDERLDAWCESLRSHFS
ncbi:flavodoxin [Marinagarivorans cellulosilyticus]|uniref:Flavodoxin n=1 Tax=Marinagarivorans cellulosilyticus TaxID=2721545 RepID=A0AAN2BL91_9GAMM|nr:flavodoxin [Marinagarivorans cellulosilyticus]BCD98775.1 flavodoxin I [Marinagarivorans cellulosilyticus]